MPDKPLSLTWTLDGNGWIHHELLVVFLCAYLPKSGLKIMQAPLIFIAVDKKQEV